MNMSVCIEPIVSQLAFGTVDSFGNCTLLSKLCNLWFRELSYNRAHHHRSYCLAAKSAPQHILTDPQLCSQVRRGMCQEPSRILC